MREGNSEPHSDGNMKRRLLIAAVFLLAGAVVNVAVAWGCAAWAPAAGARIPISDPPQLPAQQ